MIWEGQLKGTIQVNNKFRLSVIGQNAILLIMLFFMLQIMGICSFIFCTAPALSGEKILNHEKNNQADFGKGKLCWFNMEKLFWLHPDLSLINPKNDLIMSAQGQKKANNLKKEIQLLTSKLKKSFIFCEAEKRLLIKKALLIERKNGLIKNRLDQNITKHSIGDDNKTSNSEVITSASIKKRMLDLDNLYQTEKIAIDQQIAELKNRLVNIKESTLPIDFLPGINSDILNKIDAVISSIHAAGAVNITTFSNLLSARKAMLEQDLPDPIQSWLWISNVSDQDLQDLIRLRISSRASLYTDLSKKNNIQEIFGAAAGRNITEDILKKINLDHSERGKNE